MNIKIELEDGIIKEFKNIKSYKETNGENWKDNTIFDIGMDDFYYYCSNTGEVCGDRYTSEDFDSLFVEYGNACKNDEYIIKRAKEIKLSNLLSNFAKVVNEGWRPDWDSDEEKYYIGYNYSISNYLVESRIWHKSIGDVYFKSKELAQRAIDEIIMPFERGEI